MLKDQVGMSAGIVWSLLSVNGGLSIRQIGELTNYKESYIYMALGWLLKEDKISFVDKNGILYAELTVPFSEKYY